MSVQKFSSLDEVADRANRTRYGLGASIFTKDVGKAHYLSHAIRAGTVWYVRYYVIFSAWVVHHIRKCPFLSYLNLLNLPCPQGQLSQRVRRFHAFRWLQGEWIWQGIGRVWAGSLHRGQIYRHSHPKEDQLETRVLPIESETNLGTNEQLNSFLPIFFRFFLDLQSSPSSVTIITKVNSTVRFCAKNS